jgi:hypothetical protein
MEQVARSVTKIELSDRASDIFNMKRIGIALGPGFPIGLVDLGMLIALEQLKIPVNMISGTSMAAVPEGRHYIMAEPGGVNLILVISKPLNIST